MQDMDENQTTNEHDSLTKQDNSVQNSTRQHGCCVKIKSLARNNIMLLLTLSGIIFGFAIGFCIRHLTPSKDTLIWIGMPGELYLRLLKLMILPLIVCSVISGSSGLDAKLNGKMTLIAFSYVLPTNIIACILAVVLCFLIKPGGSGIMIQETRETVLVETQDIFADLLRNIFPDNLVKATFSKSQTKNSLAFKNVHRNDTNGSSTETVSFIQKSVEDANGVNVIGIMTICVLVGIATSKLKKKAKVFFAFFAGGTEIILLILRWVMWTTPVGVLSLITVAVASVNDVVSVFEQLGLFVVTVTVGISIETVVVLPAVLFVLTRRNPYSYLISMIRPWIIALATASTAVAIPEMLYSCEVKNKIDKRVARFIIPLSTAINSDGSSLFISTAVIFIAKLTGSPLSGVDYIVICLLTGVSGLALPSVPSASIVALILVLTSLNIPVEYVSLLFAVEWYLDRIRTACNLLSHTCCTAVTYHFCKEDLQNLNINFPCDDLELKIETTNNNDLSHL